MELSNNQIIDITPLLGLTNLNVLSLYNNPITDLNLSIELTQKYLTLSTAPIDSEKTTELVRKIYTTIGREAPRIIVCSSPQIAYLNFIEPLKIDCISQIATGNLGWGKSLLPTFRTLGCHNRFDRKFEQKLSDFLYKVQRNLFDDRQSKILKCLKFVVWLLGGAEDGLLKELFQSVDVGLSRVLWKVLCDEIRLEPNADRILVSEFEELLEDYPESLEYEFRSDSNYLKPLTSRDMVKEIHLTEFLIAKFGMTLDLRSQELFRCKQQLFEECGWIFPFEKICLICDRPLHIRFDRENRLHAEGESAIAFADGYSLYFHHGVKLPEQYGKVHPDLWQAEWLLSEENAELRRLLIQRIGYDRICQQLQAVELDSWQEYTLLKIDNADVEPIYLLKMTCPSTGHIHALRVPPALESAKDAISWVNWDIEPEQFSVQT
ncbi:leucine-rich repeat domain-containing protein [Microcoleus sp. CAWBG27]|uniref:leucine-rich repeat domain-containing protein n=1 Tax=Microcoleus sp. CAWBG27 TaxID=2841645 RepID=UPI00260022AF|nr:leucine-rich repeat domain-containing protein [Microcoleus sp. CAWBG27]